ncbi:probable plastid-lipid-associated protein 4, chloroplastic isoform X2 [Sesamum indicum]|uniref:Probable plastid-lipid-associated protein 4, chloroplastic isoform X2 n=1 Tax=Sesamum indicum TaxID=4182 RepID=A0A6I9UDX5_SESIN|nr:probable plastid-lipid-associated protein 4, chloroplastic isoform X2 [Sesamum indicum]
MATLRFLSPPTLLHNPTDFYSATVSSPKRCLSLSSNNRNRDVRLRSRSNSVNQNLDLPKSGQWRTGVSFFSSFLVKSTEIERLKQELLEAIAPLDRGAAATPEDQQRVDKIACKLEATNKVKEPLNSNLLNGKWELLYTTSKSILQTEATANLVPLNARRVAVKFDTFKIAAVIPIKSRGSGRGQIEITFLDEELRITRGNQGNLFILRMVDPLYRVPP